MGLVAGFAGVLSSNRAVASRLCCVQACLAIHDDHDDDALSDAARMRFSLDWRMWPD